MTLPHVVAAWVWTSASSCKAVQGSLVRSPAHCVYSLGITPHLVLRMRATHTHSHTPTESGCSGTVRVRPGAALCEGRKAHRVMPALATRRVGPGCRPLSLPRSSHVARGQARPAPAGDTKASSRHCGGRWPERGDRQTGQACGQWDGRDGPLLSLDTDRLTSDQVCQVPGCQGFPLLFDVASSVSCPPDLV